MLKEILSFSWAGMNLQRNDSSASPELPSEAKIFRPVLQPSESIPPTGIYSVKEKNYQGNGVVFIHLHTCERVFCAQGPTCWTLWKGNLASKLPWEWSTSSPSRRSESVGHVSHGLVFQHILHIMCVSVSICAGEVSRAGLTTPNCQGKSCQLFFRANCRREVRCDKKSLFCCVSDVVLQPGQQQGPGQRLLWQQGGCSLHHNARQCSQSAVHLHKGRKRK